MVDVFPAFLLNWVLEWTAVVNACPASGNPKNSIIWEGMVRGNILLPQLNHGSKGVYSF